MNILKRGDGIVSLAQIPHIEARVLIVIIGHDKLSRQFGVPHHTSALLTRALLVTLSEVGLGRRLLGLCELEDGLRCLEVPDDNFAILACTGEDVRHNPVPADSRDVATFVVVGLTGLELTRLAQVLRNILNKDFRTATRQKVFPVWIKFQRLHGDWAVNLGGRNASLAHLLDVLAFREQLFDVPKSDGAILHATCNDSKLINLVNPVQCREHRWTLSGANSLESVLSLILVHSQEGLRVSDSAPCSGDQ